MRIVAATLFALTVSVIAVPGARAQFLSFRADQLGASVDPADRGVRLLAMGTLRFVVPDESNEINLADFGQHVAGAAGDMDGWSVETALSRYRRTLDYPATQGGAAFTQREAFTSNLASTRVVYRNGAGRAVGGTFRWIGHRNEFRQGDNSRVRGPVFDAFWNESFGQLALGMGVTQWEDEETLTSTDVFSVHHASSVLAWRFGAIYPLFGVNWGGQYEFDRVRIEGKSLDPSGFHQDDYEWLRPTQRVRFSAFLPEGGDLELGANLSFFQLDGAEDAVISWADRFPYNPGGFDYDREVPIFEEEESGYRLEGRALYWLGWAPRVGAFFARESRSSDVVESSNFIGSRRAGSLDRTRTEVGGGLGTSLYDERLLVAVEGLGVFTSDEVVDRRGVADERTAQDLSARLGLEWFARPDFALRAGYERLSEDADTDEPFTLQTGQAASFGFGWTPKGATYVLDGAFRLVDRTPDDDRGPERDSFELALYARLLY